MLRRLREKILSQFSPKGIRMPVLLTRTVTRSEPGGRMVVVIQQMEKAASMTDTLELHFAEPPQQHLVREFDQARSTTCLRAGRQGH